jgi:hypothetical protein
MPGRDEEGVVPTWNEKSFFDEAERRLPRQQVEALRDLYEFFHQPGWDVTFGKGKVYGSFHAICRELPPRPVLTAYTHGGIYVNFDRFHADAGGVEPDMARLAQELRRAGFDLPEELRGRSPGYKPEVWAPRRPALERAFRNAYEASLPDRL